jgi:hypothetical protein
MDNDSGPALYAVPPIWRQPVRHVTSFLTQRWEQPSGSGSWALVGNLVDRLLVFEPEAVVASFGSLLGSAVTEMKQKFVR